MSASVPKGAPILVVAAPWVGMLLSGEKTVEVRGSACRKPPGTFVYLSESKTGTVCGRVTFAGTIDLSARREWESHRAEHCVPDADPSYGARTRGWRFRDPVRISPPVPYEVKKGAIVWRKF